MHFPGIRLPKLQTIARHMLTAEMALVLLAAVGTLIAYLSEAESDRILASLRYTDAPAYILASFSLAVATSLLCDLAERRNRP